jgi:hypothetical protein
MLAIGLIEQAVKAAEKKGTAEIPKGEIAVAENDSKPAVKPRRVVKPADIVKTTYLETSDDVNGFLDALRQELEQAINNNERIQIR